MFSQVSVKGGVVHEHLTLPLSPRQGHSTPPYPHPQTDDPAPSLSLPHDPTLDPTLLRGQDEAKRMWGSGGVQWL